MKTSALYTIGLLTLLSLTLFAAPKNNSKAANLKAGIASSNEGLKKSAMYMAGKYMVSETAADLVKELKNSDNNIKILAALSLLRINDSRAMAEVKTAAENETDTHTKNMLSAIYNEYSLGTGNYTASINR
jgi:hypothetical protein